MSKPKVLVIVGPTASGKTSLSIELAKQFSGEVISADSRQVYRGMDLGSGKVTQDEMGNVPHHLLDVANPMEVYTASDFKRDASKAVEEILERNNLPIIAGGTFFYVDALLGRSQLPEIPPNEDLRAHLEELTPELLYKQLEQLDPERAFTIDKHNKRRLVRALEIVNAVGKVPKPIAVESKYDVLTIGIEIDKEVLHKNIHTRLLERLDEGMVAEVEGLLAVGVTHDRLEELGLEYRYLSRYLRGDIEYETMAEELENKIRQFSKRQMTWLKRDKTIQWYLPTDLKKITEVVDDWLSN